MSISYKFILLTCGISASIFISSCKKFVEVDPPRTQTVSNAVFTSDANATSAITGIYEKMGENIPSLFNGGTTLYAGMSADELIYFSSNSSYNEFNINAVTPSNALLKNDLWGLPYQCIYQANAVIEGLTRSTGVTPSLKQQLTGEAKFIRAFCHFYLVNFFADVPLILTTDYRLNRKAIRVSKTEVYQQIIKDLKDAQNLLSDNYITAERVRPNKSTATALLSRAYLYIGDWINAEVQSAGIINNSTQN